MLTLFSIKISSTEQYRPCIQVQKRNSSNSSLSHAHQCASTPTYSLPWEQLTTADFQDKTLVSFDIEIQRLFLSVTSDRKKDTSTHICSKHKTTTKPLGHHCRETGFLTPITKLRTFTVPPKLMLYKPSYSAGSINRVKTQQILVIDIFDCFCVQKVSKYFSPR